MPSLYNVIVWRNNEGIYAVNRVRSTAKRANSGCDCESRPNSKNERFYNEIIPPCSDCLQIDNNY